MWIVGMMLLGAGVVGLFPSYGSMQMPLWLAVMLTIVGGLVIVISPSSGTQATKPVPHPPKQHPDEHPCKAS